MRSFLAFSALALMLCAAPAANANLVTHTSDFRNSNLSTSLPNYSTDLGVVFGSKVSSFNVVPTMNNTLGAGDSVTFTSVPAVFFRGTSSPTSVPGFVSFVDSLNSSYSVQFNTVNPVTEIRLSVADLETLGSLTFTSLAGGSLSTSGTLTFSGNTVNGTNANAYQGDVVLSFSTPVVNPAIAFTYNQAFALDQTHFSGLSYTTLAAIPEPLSFVWFASAFGLVQYGRRSRMDADLAD